MGAYLREAAAPRSTAISNRSMRHFRNCASGAGRRRRRLSGGEQQMCAIGRGLMRRAAAVDDRRAVARPFAVAGRAAEWRRCAALNANGYLDPAGRTGRHHRARSLPPRLCHGHGTYRAVRLGTRAIGRSDRPRRLSRRSPGMTEIQQTCRSIHVPKRRHDCMDRRSSKQCAYRFMPGVTQYSCGIAALPGFTIQRVRFADPVPLKAGFERIARKFSKTPGVRSRRSAPAVSARRPRSPKRAFAPSTISTSRRLIEWGVMQGRRQPGGARNVLSENRSARGALLPRVLLCTPSATGRRNPSSSPAAAKSVEGKANYRDHIVSPGDVSPARRCSPRQDGYWMKWSAA